MNLSAGADLRNGPGYPGDRPRFEKAATSQTGPLHSRAELGEHNLRKQRCAIATWLGEFSHEHTDSRRFPPDESGY
jgi:hypothetical protein